MTKTSSLFQAALRVGLMLSIATPAFSQSNNGTIRGAVLDPSGAFISGAQINVSSISGFSRAVKSSPTGVFEVPQLAPGIYSISVNANGFTPALEGGIHVEANRVTRDSVKLGISVNQVIEVFADDSLPHGSRTIRSL